MGQGIRLHLSHLDHKITQDFTLFMERDNVPQFDFTPSYLVAANFDFIEFGAGISFNHFLPVKPSLLRPKLASNAYVSLESYPEIPTQVSGKDTLQYYHAAGPQKGLEKEFENLQQANGNNPFKYNVKATFPSRSIVMWSAESEVLYFIGIFRVFELLLLKNIFL